MSPKPVTISRHTLPGGEEHLDIFILTFPEREKSLLCLEAESIREQNIFSSSLFDTRKKEDHRGIYLEYEGELSQNRGSVQIIWKGFTDFEFPETQKQYLIKIQQDILYVL
ncbi:MAG: hypothetical protein H7A25_04055 [Leptospiraceae bacterium]|nr:hypothetical protein [Leptospiraceae bacterium]MCP5499049.1 hypothetical protein [Leptospiraceae bacterium]